MNSLIRRQNNSVDFFEDFFEDFFVKPVFKDGVGCMKTDILQTDEGYELHIDVPGFGKEDIHITLEKGYVTIEAKKEEEKEQKDTHFLRRERFLGSSARSFYVGEEIAERDIKASYDKGVLVLFIPKKGTNVKEKKYIAIE